MHAAEPLVLEPNYFKVEIAIQKLIRYKSPGTDQPRAMIFQLV
jgi:hypothetical protein